MFLVEIVMALACLVMFGVDVVLALSIFEKYITLPRLRAERVAYLADAYDKVKALPAKRLKAVNDKIRRTSPAVLTLPAKRREMKVA